MLKLAQQLAHLWRDISGMCPLLPILPMGSTSSLDLVTTPFESGMPRLVLHWATLLQGTLIW